MNKRNRVIIISLLGLTLLVGGFFITTQPTSQQRGVTDDPSDIVLDFYNDWVKLRQATDTDPFASELLQSPALSEEFTNQLLLARKDFQTTGFDPVVCGTTIPSQKRSREIYANDTEAQILVFDRDSETSVQRVFTLKGDGTTWQITNINCTAAEQALNPGEFSFDTTGYLLRNSLPDSFDKQYWYLVYESNGESGYTAPLLFTDNSVCTQADGSEIACGDEYFSETARVSVQGSMTEAGPEVVRLRFTN